jgi:protocatechuate 3,4-dioxygenase beta subunit
MRTLFLIPLIAFSQDQTGSIGGVVTDAVTHQPIKRAIIRINAVDGGTFVNTGQPLPDAHNATTDAAGAYTLTGLAPKTYEILIHHPKYPRPASKPIEVKAGEKATFDAALSPGASISGRVLDEDGDPIPGCFVSPHPAKSPNQGVSFQGGTQPSDADAEFRIFGLAPGKYVISANCGVAVFQPRPLSAGPDPPPSAAYPLQYYPLAKDAKSAEVIELFAGMEKPGVDFRMRPVPVTQIHGRISSAGADVHGDRVYVQLMPVDWRRGVGLGPIAAAFDDNKSTFDFRQVFPGSYLLIAGSYDPEHPNGFEQRIEVADRPLNLTVELRPAVELKGTMQWGGNPPADFKMSQLYLQLIPAPGPMHSPLQTQVNDDGTFKFPPFRPGRYRILMQRPDAFIGSAHVGSQDVTDGEMDLSNGAPGPLNIVLSMNWATIQGTGRPGTIVFWERMINDGAGTGGGGSGIPPDGHFQMQFAPGKYRLVTLARGEPMPEEGGEFVTVRAGETVTVDLKPRQ